MAERTKRSGLLDWASRFMDGLTGGAKKDVAEGVEGKTKRQYSEDRKAESNASKRKRLLDTL